MLFFENDFKFWLFINLFFSSELQKARPHWAENLGFLYLSDFYLNADKLSVYYSSHLQRNDFITYVINFTSE